jgi:hypothetical protein
MAEDVMTALVTVVPVEPVTTGLAALEAPALLVARSSARSPARRARRPGGAWDERVQAD